MTVWRLSELRQTLHFVREARAALARGDLPKAFRLHKLALRGLSVLRGIACRTGGQPCATATLARVVDDLGDDIEAALQPAPAVAASELVPHLIESLKVLQRDGVDVTDEALIARARNAAVGLAGSFRFTALENPQPVDPSSLTND